MPLWESLLSFTSAYLNLKTGEVFSVSDDDFRTAEEEEAVDHLPDWQQEDIKTAIDVLENFDDYKDTLLDAIRGKGAFRRFQDKIRHLGVEAEWYAFRNGQYQQIAVKWCNNHNINYIE